jgi:replicative superfamily II helicase
MQELNPIQSTVYPTAFQTNANMLICAPTGAGKTNIALMAVLREIGSQNPESESLARKRFTIIYVTPMKALAAEIVDKFSKMLGYLKLRVRELTGDMQLSRTEIEETHMLVVTPEKLDVITRKSDNLFVQTKLLILDEIHLLDEDRGAVIECLVIRTLNHIQRKQIPLRIIGLSATLPNYKDVATFLQVGIDSETEGRPTMGRSTSTRRIGRLRWRLTFSG